MNTSTTLLRAFRHPLLIGSILLLLVNDHLLKAASPSWLTGKLSDFAGLFFFPFLLALLLQRVMKREDRAVGLGLLLTGLVFAAIKTLPLANAALTWVASRLLGPTVRFVLDPSDLLALVMLPAGWLFWKWLRANRTAEPPGKLAYAVLALGALSALATSPCPPASHIDRVIAVEGRLYTGWNYSWSTQEPTLYVLSDDQQTWNYVREPGEQVHAALKTPAPEMPITQCDPSAPLLCYQIDAQARIQESRDGGQTWKVSWQYPARRETYMNRAGIPGACTTENPDRRLYDLAILPGLGSPTVVVAAGNQGVLILRDGEEWQRMGVEARATPSPWQSANLGQAFSIISPEFLFAGTASLLAYTILSVLGRMYSPFVENGKRRHPSWALHPGLFVLPWLLAGLAIWLGTPEGAYLRAMAQMCATYALLLMLGVLLFTATKETGRLRKAGLLALLAVFAVLALPVTIFLLWAFSIIAYYPTALILTLAVTPPVFGGLFFQIRRVLAGQ